MPAPPSHRGALGRLLAACAIVFACCAGGVVAVGATELHATARALEAQPRVDLGEDETVVTSTTTGGGERDAHADGRTILLIGSDHRAKAAARDARSDTMMLVRLSPRAKAVSVLSVPRDLRVQIPGKGTAKLNAAYAYGGVPLAVRTLRAVLGTRIDHVIDVDFAGFHALVDELGCVYTDVDRRYFNRNDGTAATNYASIDIRAGYQRLCGADALDYVRYRHGDNDLVRAARQQDFLRQARTQIGVADLLGDRHALLRLLGRHTRTDIRGSKQVTALAKLVVAAADKPVVQVPFPATIGPSYVYAEPAVIERTVHRFLHPAATGPARATGAEPKRKRVRSRARLPAVQEQTSRTYTVKDAQGTSHRARRRTFRIAVGEYYGVQTLDWPDPPLLAAPHEERTLGGRTFSLYYDGSKLRRVALQSGDGAAWVSNTLTLRLTNAQMLRLARRL